MSQEKISSHRGDLQTPVQALLDQFVAEGKQRGLQVAAYLDGKLVIDAFAGTADEAKSVPVDGGTLFPIFSTTKGIAATLAHLMVERGLLAYETPVSKVWPEFAAHGKGTITLRHTLNHTAGLSLMPLGLDDARLLDWDFMCAAIADMTPTTKPGLEMAYQAVTYSWTVGEVVRRVGGRPLPQMIREEIGEPLGVADGLFCGLPNDEQNRVAYLTSELASEPLKPDPQSVPGWMQPLHEWMNRPDARRACAPGSSGVMTARAVARHYAALVPGGVDGVELLSPERVRLAARSQFAITRKHEPVPPIYQGLGYQVGYFSPTTFGHGGFGGSMGMADTQHKLAFGFARNHFSSHDPQGPVLEEIRRVLAG